MQNQNQKERRFFWIAALYNIQRREYKTLNRGFANPSFGNPQIQVSGSCKSQSDPRGDESADQLSSNYITSPKKKDFAPKIGGL